jgi:hypothetical protein
MLLNREATATAATAAQYNDQQQQQRHLEDLFIELSVPLCACVRFSFA